MVDGCQFSIQEKSRIGQIPSGSGSYLLVFHLARSELIRIGKLGEFWFSGGYYFYSGSAFGPGGLQSRIQRHLRMLKPKKWHVDWLRPRVVIRGVWITQHPLSLECAWVGELQKLGMLGLVPGFGSSDCTSGCPAHLLYHKQSIPHRVIHRALLNSLPVPLLSGVIYIRLPELKIDYNHGRSQREVLG